MSYGYSVFEGLKFPKGSDKEYVEEWGSSFSAERGVRTINGDFLNTKTHMRTLTVRGSGNVAPECGVEIGKQTAVRSEKLNHICQMRLDKWQVNWVPWEFKYVWSYTFSEVAI